MFTVLRCAKKPGANAAISSQMAWIAWMKPHEQPTRDACCAFLACCLCDGARNHKSIRVNTPCPSNSTMVGCFSKMSLKPGEKIGQRQMRGTARVCFGADASQVQLTLLLHVLHGARLKPCVFFPVVGSTIRRCTKLFALSRLRWALERTAHTGWHARFGSSHPPCRQPTVPSPPWDPS